MESNLVNSQEHLCRICAKIEKFQLHIFGSNGREKQIFDKIKMCLSLEISSEDNLPQTICYRCLAELNNHYKYWKKATHSDKILRQRILITSTIEQNGNNTKHQDFNESLPSTSKMTNKSYNSQNMDVNVAVDKSKSIRSINHKQRSISTPKVKSCLDETGKDKFESKRSSNGTKANCNVLSENHQRIKNVSAADSINNTSNISHSSESSSIDVPRIWMSDVETLHNSLSDKEDNSNASILKMWKQKSTYLSKTNNSNNSMNSSPESAIAITRNQPPFNCSPFRTDRKTKSYKSTSASKGSKRNKTSKNDSNRIDSSFNESLDSFDILVSNSKFHKNPNCSMSSESELEVCYSKGVKYGKKNINYSEPNAAGSKEKENKVDAGQDIFSGLNNEGKSINNMAKPAVTISLRESQYSSKDSGAFEEDSDSSWHLTPDINAIQYLRQCQESRNKKMSKENNK